MNTFTNQHSSMPTNARKPVTIALLLTGLMNLNLANAATLPNNAALTITPGTVGTDDYVSGGSYFGMDKSGDSRIQLSEKTAINYGYACTIGPKTVGSSIPVGSTTTARGSHTGCINGTETPAFDIWEFFSNTGMNYLTAPITDNGNGTLFLGGWTVTWNSILAIPMNSRAWNPLNCAALGCADWTFTNSIARFQWIGTAGGAWSSLNGTSYTLDYTATVPHGDPSNFGDTEYYLHLVGTVSLPEFTLGADNAVAKTAVAKTIDVTTNDTQTNYVIDSNSVVIGTPALHGTAVANADNTVTYTSTGGYIGPDSFTYTVRGGGITSDAATVAITVSTVSPPTANADTATTNGTTEAIVSVLSNDTLGDFAISNSTVAISTAASHGTATANSNGTVTYAANAGYTGVDTFQYTVNDTSSNTSNSATVSMTVRATVPASATGTLSPGTTAIAAGGRPATTGGGLTESDVGDDSALVQQCVGDCFDFRVTGVTAGSTVRVVLPLSAAIPTTTDALVYRKKSASGAWVDFSTANGNQLASAAAISAGPVCPEAGSVLYTSGLTAGNECIQLTIVEGDANDADNVSTTISDPSGVGVKNAFVDTRSDSTGGCSISSNPNLDAIWKRGDWWLVLGFIGWLGMVIRRRRHQA